MLQRLVTLLVRLVANTFFRRIDVAGLEHIPGSGPVIFAGNHPNALMDGSLLTAKCGRWPIHFLANAKLWQYRLLGPMLDASGAIPVFRREEHGDETDNRSAFDRLFETLEAGHCVGIFPEGVSHVESQLIRLKTGTARAALGLAARGRATAPIVPVGLNYMHRHRFRSQVYIEFGEPIRINAEWVERFNRNEQGAVEDLTDQLAEALRKVTVNAPDWRTLRLIQAARRLYKPSAAKLTPGQYIELNRRFVTGYLADREDPELEALTADIEDYQARLEMLGLRDHQLRQPITISRLARKMASRSLLMMLLLPFALPGALLHLPVGWAAATVGERFSYERDDIATLKVFSTILLLPLLYILLAVVVGIHFGTTWAIGVIILLPMSFFATVRLLEAEAGLMNSMLSILRLSRLREDVTELRRIRANLVERVRKRVDERADPDLPRIFSREDFGA